MIEKLKTLQVNFSLFLFIFFTIKLLAVQITIADSIVAFVFGTVYSYSQYLKRFQPYKLDDAVTKDLIEVKSALAKMNLIRASEKMQEKKYF